MGVILTTQVLNKLFTTKVLNKQLYLLDLKKKKNRTVVVSALKFSLSETDFVSFMTTISIV